MDVAIIIAIGLVALIVAGFLVGRAMRDRPVPVPAHTERLGGRIKAILRGEPSEEDWGALEQTLIEADAGTRAARELVTRVREAWEPGSDPVWLMQREVRAMFEGDPVLELPPGLAVVMVVGVNGTGKTTTIGKLAKWLADQGRKVAVAASDTFRAGAVEQLGTWAERAGADLVSQERGADPGAVAHDAVQAALARGRDVLIVDTAGRIHTRTPLMDELAKVRRVLERAAGKPPDEVLLVLDATTGQNGIAQARVFLDAVDVTGIVLTKMDGTAGGGVVLAIREELGLPVKLVGTGEKLGDLERFHAKVFAASLV